MLNGKIVSGIGETPVKGALVGGLEGDDAGQDCHRMKEVKKRTENCMNVLKGKMRSKRILKKYTKIASITAASKS